MMLFSTLFTFLAVLQPISCWGSLGHRTVGYLAEKYFTPASHHFVNKLLANNQGWDISDAALFADAVKDDRPWTKQWHWIDAQDDPPRQCEVNYRRDCKNQGKPGCIVSAITNMTHVVSNSSSKFIDRKEALMFLIHFLGDIHQPLHTENASQGGNKISVKFDGNNNNLHAVWDSSIVLKYRGLPKNLGQNKEKEAAAKWANELYHSVQDKSLQECKPIPECHNISDPQTCALQWASEANCRICTHVLAPNITWIESNDLGGVYYKAAVPVVVDLVGKAGLRLGAWINALSAALPPPGNFVVQGTGRDSDYFQDPEL